MLAHEFGAEFWIARLPSTKELCVEDFREDSNLDPKEV
jgi:hypothetical protein